MQQSTNRTSAAGRVSGASDHGVSCKSFSGVQEAAYNGRECACPTAGSRPRSGQGPRACRTGSRPRTGRTPRTSGSRPREQVVPAGLEAGREQGVGTRQSQTAVSRPRTGRTPPDCRKATKNTAYPSDYRKATENTAYPSDCRKPAENRTGTPYLSAAGNRAYPLDCRKLAENGSYPSDCRKPTEKRARTPYQSDDWKLDEKTGEDAVPVGLD